MRTAPTPAQIAARQAIPKELPHFHGHPEEWPLFISSLETSTEIAGYSNAENLMRLQACLKGKAREMVQSKLLLPAMVPEIIQTLRMCFGRPELIIENLIEKVKRVPPIKDRLDGLIDFALCVRNVYSTMESCRMGAYMNNPTLVKDLVDKLPNNHKLAWAMHPKGQHEPIVKIFSDWLYALAEAASQVVGYTTPKRGGIVNTHMQTTNAQRDVTCSHCNAGGHRVAQCEDFRKLSSSCRWDVVRALKLCRQCLNAHRRRCFVPRTCGVDGCKAKHHPLLHASTALNAQNSPEYPSATASGSVNSHDDAKRKSSPYFRILPVRIHGNGNYIDTFAFLDEGSSVTLIEEKIFKQLNMRGVPDPLCLRWTGDNTRNEDASVRTSLKISGIQHNKAFNITGVHTVSHLGLPRQTVDMAKITKDYPYITGLPIQSYVSAKPTLLIGSHNWQVAVPLKIREGSWCQPIATKTRLGWAIQGRCGGSSSNARLNIHTCACKAENERLHKMVKEHFQLDDPKPTMLRSPDDQKALAILDSTCRKINNRYEVGLLWRHEEISLPDSYEMAYKRLVCLNNKFRKDPSLKLAMQKQIDNLLAKGYAKKLNTAELVAHKGRVWYMPIFVTCNPNKPGKMRLVWDAAAKSKGVALNDAVLGGPDFLIPLVDILLKFRIGKVAICGDIAEMFHQINVTNNDMHVQRFLWLDNEDDISQPSVYVMRALTFGISCAPCIAHYVRDKNANTFVQQFPEAVDAITRYHYVDDFIYSGDSEQAVIQLAKTVKHIHAAAGFHIRNWASNSAVVLKHMEGSCNRTQEPLQLNSNEKILGVYWDPNKDVFKYSLRFTRLKRNVVAGDTTPTKREILQVLMSIFDPLGLLSNYTITLKILLQEIWRSGLDWDEEIDAAMESKWCQWKIALSAMAKLEIPRCYSFHLDVAEDVQLHTFADAGEFGYAAVCYLRVKSGSRIDVSIVAAKSKVAPLNPVSIPRLELQAAVLGARLASKIQGISRLQIKKRIFWTDSTTVLKWLGMDPRQFRQFVMFRVADILERTNLNQWKWVPSLLNPSDRATKVDSKTDASLWFNGPTFLQYDESKWPYRDDLGPVDNSEVKNHLLHIRKLEQKKLTINFEYFSNWRRLYRALARFILYIEKVKAKSRSRELPNRVTFEMVKAAKTALITQAQLSEYENDLLSLRSGKSIEKSSKLNALDVFVDEFDVIRVRGRAEFLAARSAVVLPGKHHVAYLIVKDAHERYQHISHETAINEIRGRFHIPRLRVLYRMVRRMCQTCKNKFAVPRPPQMAPLPAARLASFERPFSYVGIDYFGPMLVAVGRHREKRWGVIFTCLTVRAIHVEIAYSLDTSSCVLCLRNFISRRGVPREIYTDNGTNFKATNNILRIEANQVDYATIQTKFDNIKWNFNPPAAPHMGGAWERLIRSIKTVLNGMHPEHNFNDETLRSALLEVEFMINSRPLTFVTIDGCDDEALTPNHILMGSSSGYKPIGTSGDLRQRYRQTQLYVDRFWQRWVQEYRPILTRRSKWFEKQPPLKVGDVVVIVDESMARNCWPKGIIVDVVTAKDGQVRRATVKTACGILDRPAIKLAVLDVGNPQK
ncbi:uncharacterized protein LOC118750014 [Rhagoletis pomonella]|uniref:uncharacterized protein LOC118750014 n=1 Tax=Rhagoletis pomonella TaxID=28610 RepID=UPI00177E2186|nr:uncharacterized protein LOC118750014 [Rhagoletis pomonella]